MVIILLPFTLTGRTAAFHKDCRIAYTAFCRFEELIAPSPSVAQQFFEPRGRKWHASISVRPSIETASTVKKLEGARYPVPSVADFVRVLNAYGADIENQSQVVMLMLCWFL